MRGRLLLLLALSVLLFALQILPAESVPAMAASDYLIWIDVRAMSLTLYQGDKQVGRWPIAAGTGSTPTPVGVFRISHRFKTAELGGFGTRFLGLNVPWGQYGIHGTNKPGSIGSHASHGCIRMFAKDAEKLYSLVPNGTKVVIEDGPYGRLGYGMQKLTPQSRGSQVAAAQERLQHLGYYQGSIDGIYGRGMSAALKNFKADNGLPWVDCVDQATWDALGVMLFE